jgi:hypothetical protein
MTWVAAIGGRLESRYRINATLVYKTGPNRPGRRLGRVSSRPRRKQFSKRGTLTARTPSPISTTRAADCCERQHAEVGCHPSDVVITRIGVVGGANRPDVEFVLRRRNRRVARVVVALVFAVGVSAFNSTVASASTSDLAQTGSLTMTSDPGDYIGQGLTYSYATPTNVFFARTENWYGENNRISVTMRTDAASLDYWVLTFAAPPGESLKSGTYSGAVRTIWQTAGQSGFDVWGMGRACNTSTSTFTVSQAVFGPDGYVQSFRASFEQHCEGSAPALRGEVAVSNPPPPPPLSAQVSSLSAQLSAHGSMTVSGTVACTRPIDPNRSYVQLAVSEPSKDAAIEGFAAFALPSDCGTAARAWQSVVTPADPKTPFTKGTAAVTAWVQLGDPIFGTLLFQEPVATSLTVKEN